MIPHKTPVRHPYSGNRNVNITISYIARVTGNHPTSTGPISLAASRTQILVSITLVPRRMQLGFQAIPKNLMHIIRNRYRLQYNKNSRLCPGLAFTGGTEVRDVSVVIFRTWFGASDIPLMTSTWFLETSFADSGEIS
jgi:hypothetical protein